MLLLREPEDFRRACDEARALGHRVGLVPTMGALHPGHVTLVTEARKHAVFVAVSVFVNPTQFGPNEDLARYPRTLEADMARCEEAGAAVVFAPSAEAMYPPGDETRVHVGPTAAPLCGAHRPGHFEGVATVVTKLFALTGPCHAFFGRKDYQQLKVIERFTRDLFLPVIVTGVRTVREPDGLAMSSRNAYLSAEQRAGALAIPRGLTLAAGAFAKGERDAGALRRLARAEVEKVASSIDYVDLADPETLRVFTDGEVVGERALIAMAIRLGGARLIDNMVLGEEPPPLQGAA
jgi:pantoate--beta-alanine ligase